MGQRLHLRHESSQVLGKLVLGDLQPQLGFLETREIEQIADHLQQLEAAAEHGLERRSVRGELLSHLALQDLLERCQQHRQRCLEFVRDVGEQLRLEAVQRLELVVGSFQRRLGVLQPHLAREHLLLRSVVHDLSQRRDKGHADQ